VDFLLRVRGSILSTTLLVLDGKTLDVFYETLHGLASIWERSARAHSFTSVTGRSFRIDGLRVLLSTRRHHGDLIRDNLYARQ